jgi:ERF superfamily
MKNSQTELVVQSKTESTEISASAGAMLAVIERAASNKEIDVEKMERLFALQERMLAKQAEEKFNEAMKSVQAEVPRILRDAVNPATNSKYTRLESLLKIIVPIYTQHGFSLSFGTADCPVANHYRITAKVSLGGHSEKYQCDIPADITGMKGNTNKTPTHGFGSTMSYGRRYLTLLIFNIALINEDDDAKTQRQSSTGKVATAATRNWFLEQTKDIHVKLQAYAIDKAIIMPDQALDEYPLQAVPTSKSELAKLRQKVEAHQ